MAKKLSERLAYLLADNNVKSSNGILQDLQELEEKLELAANEEELSIAHGAFTDIIDLVFGE